MDPHPASFQAVWVTLQHGLTPRIPSFTAGPWPWLPFSSRHWCHVSPRHVTARARLVGPGFDDLAEMDLALKTASRCRGAPLDLGITVPTNMEPTSSPIPGWNQQASLQQKCPNSEMVLKNPLLDPPPLVCAWGDWLAMVAANPLFIDVPHITKFTLHGRLYTCWCYLWATKNPSFTAITSHYRTSFTIHWPLTTITNGFQQQSLAILDKPG